VTFIRRPFLRVVGDDLGSHPRRWATLTAGVAVAALSAVCAAPPPVESRAVPLMSDQVRAELAPNGRLRAALNYSNFLLVSARAPEHTGVAPDLARELARRANATVEFVGYDNAGLAADAAATGAWDVAFIGAEPARAKDIRFTPAYVEINATYLVPPGSPIRSIDDVDRGGVRIATTARAAYTLYLQRTLRHATLVEAATIPAAFDLFKASRLDALAGLEPRLRDDVLKMPGSRLLDGRFTAVQQSMGVGQERAAAAAYLDAFVEEITSSGLLATLIERHGARGLTIAAPAP
jgi:polar amino acid transport system substrate-binding protein